MADHLTAGSVVTEYLAKHCDRLIALTPEALADPEVVHDTRTSLRRLRSTLRTFAGLVDADQAEHLDRETSWFAGVLGELRDRDVLADRFTQHADDLPELTADQVRPVIDDLGSQRDDASRDAAEAIGSDRYAELIATATRWRDEPPLTEVAAGPAELIIERTRRARRKERKRVKQAVKAGAPDEDLHRARKAAKRHRYAIEVESLAVVARGSTSKKKRKKRKKRARRSRKLQQRLGRHQDAVVAARFLESRPDTAAEPRKIRRILLRHERAIADETRL
jgi:CHAD domain-containing protein